MATSFTAEIVSKVAPSRMFKAGCKDIHNVAPKILPQIFTGASLLEGDGGVGTVKLFNFTEALPYRYMKERVDVFDEEKFECVYTITEGGELGKKISSGAYYLKLVPSADGGFTFKIKGEYTVIPGVDADEFVKADKEQSVGIFMAVEAYLQAYPDAYA